MNRDVGCRPQCPEMRSDGWLGGADGPEAVLSPETFYGSLTKHFYPPQSVTDRPRRAQEEGSWNNEWENIHSIGHAEPRNRIWILRS